MTKHDTRKPIQFMFGDGHGDHPTVIHRIALDEPPHDNGFWIYLGFSRRILFNARNAYIERVFDMDRRQIPPWLVIRRMWPRAPEWNPYIASLGGDRPAGTRWRLP